ncbi:hypothetical protein Ciccas_009917 [Cichlidogyrus casuarinus]|uniref:Uncharacterized protein n=1 Tax=Cichlidogyrus casuarinus TaxID=1844966 RepID=A0ABD2PYH1_9PLAT
MLLSGNQKKESEFENVLKTMLFQQAQQQSMFWANLMMKSLDLNVPMSGNFTFPAPDVRNQPQIQPAGNRVDTPHNNQSQLR